MKFGVTELLIILAVVILLFGPTQIPKLTKMVGKGVKNFRKGMNEEDDEDADSQEASDKKAEKKADSKSDKHGKEDKEA